MLLLASLCLTFPCFIGLRSMRCSVGPTAVALTEGALLRFFHESTLHMRATATGVSASAQKACCFSGVRPTVRSQHQLTGIWGGFYSRIVEKCVLKVLYLFVFLAVE